MEENPLNSRDAMHGLPPKWTRLLDQITEGQSDAGDDAQAIKLGEQDQDMAQNR